MPFLAQLKKENEKQKMQFIYLFEQINQMKQRIEDLQDIDRSVNAMVDFKTGSDNKPLPGIGGSDQDLLGPDISVEKDPRTLVRLLHRSLEYLNLEIVRMRRGMSQIHKHLKIQRGLFASTPSIWPIKGRLSSHFGYRRSPFTGEREFHNGIDIAAKRNSPVVAPADGIVISVGRNRLAGRVLSIKHRDGLITKYAHLQKIIVKKGQYVKRGEKVALVGNSGRTTGPHLHYEVHIKGVPVNPFPYIQSTE